LLGLVCPNLPRSHCPARAADCGETHVQWQSQPETQFLMRDYLLDNVAATGRNIEKGFTEDAEKLLGSLLAEPF